MAKQRSLSNEQILYLLINLREQEAKRDTYTDIKVNAEKCKEIGIFSYKMKETGELRLGKLFLISETHNGEDIILVYDENGKFIAWQNQEIDEKGNKKINIAKDIELNEDQLLKQLELGEERTQDNNNSASSSDTTKGGEGRDKADKEHEPEEDKKKKEDKDEKKQDNFLPNLKNEVNLYYRPKIRLDTIVNGYYLWEVLQLEEKLKGKLKDLDEKSFRYGYLSVVDSKELEAKDGKARKAPDTFVIQTTNGDIIELDEEIIRPKELGTSYEKMRAEQNRLRYEDGKEAEKPDSELLLTRTSLYQIPNAHERFQVNENWFLAVDDDRNWKKYGQRPVAGNTKQISFVQESRESQEAREDVKDRRVQNTLECKLEAINEDPMNKKEIEQQEQLRKKDANETINVRNEHTQELVEECYARYKDLGEYYNRNDIKEKVEKYHNEGKSDEEVIEQIGEDAENAKDIEHDFYLYGRNRRD